MPTFFVAGAVDMSHSFVPDLIELATAVADPLSLDVVGAVYHTNQSPSGIAD